MILAGRITVNRMPAEVGQKVGPGDEVRINGEVVRVRFAEPRARIMIYHKPSGELVTRDDPEGRPTVFRNLPSIGNGKWINVGRLDYNTEGLLLFTNSGELANRLMHPRYEVEREYAVRVMGRLSDDQLRALTTGVTLDDGPARCDSVVDGGGDEEGSNHWYKVVLKEGRNREVRRLFEALGIMVSRLIRTRYGGVAMPTRLKRSDLIELEAGEVAAIMASAGLRPGGPAQVPQQQRRDVRGGSARGAQAGASCRSQECASRCSALACGPRRRASARQCRGECGSSACGPSACHPSASFPAAPGQQAPRGSQEPQERERTRMGSAMRSVERSHRARPPTAGCPPQQGAQPHRPQRQRFNFDEVQPQSNANALPFSRKTLSAHGGAQRDHDGDAGLRHRSGPRAKNASFGNPAGMTRRTDGPAGAAQAKPHGTTTVRVRRRPSRPMLDADAGASPVVVTPPLSDDKG